MKTKTTIECFNAKGLKALVAVAILLATTPIFSQVVTDVFPSRITTNAKITIVGSGFTPSTTISINGISIDGGSITLVSPTEMSFKITQAGNNDVTGNLTVGGAATGLTVDYVAPIQKTLRNGPTSNVTKITEIFTTYNGFWRSSQWKADPANLDLWPNTSHDLLAFTYDGVTYSTGVDDDLLTTNGVTFSSQLFFAYTTNGVDGITQPSNFLAMADLIDGEVGEGVTITSPEILGKTIYDAIIDGVNGLDLGTGVTNFNQTSDVQFFSAGGQIGAVNDAMPDFLITQIAQAGGTDVYFYADDQGNVVGRPIRLTINEEGDNAGDALLARWRLDLYRFQNGVNYGLATPTTRAFSSDEIRPMRMIAFRLEEFEITADNVQEINNINMVAGGTADLAFLAYNRGSFDIKTPVFSQFPVSRFVCRIPSTSDISFVSTGIVSGGATGDPLETLSYQWFKFNTPITGATSSTYTLTGGIELDDLATYKVRITNSFGAVVAPATLVQGGTPTFWDGSTWQLPPSFIAAGITVNDEDRGLVFSSNYNENADVEGCNCIVPQGSNATIPSGFTLKLFDNVRVESGATLTIEDNASLIQTNNVTNNTNSGSIRVERNASDLSANDFVFWSSPVDNFNLTGVTNPQAAAAFEYDVNAPNTDGTAGSFVATSGMMASGKGYSVEAPNAFVASGFTARFVGTPRNGLITIDALKATSSPLPLEESRHWNLLGNPYPSAINVDAFLASNTFLEGSVRLWSHGNPNSNPNPFYDGVTYNYGDQYVTYNRTGATPDLFKGNIASGQAFFVQVSESAPATSSVAFNNSMRFDDAENAYDNSEFLGTSQPAPLDDANKLLVWLSLLNQTGNASVALVGYVPNATNQKDRLYDAFTDGGELSIYSTIDNSKFAIQGRALPFEDTDLVPLGIDLPSAGVYSIGIDHLKGTIFDTQGIFLEDTFLDIVHDLRASAYTFTGVAGTTSDRFILRYLPGTLSVDENSLSNTFVFVKDSQLHVSSSNNIASVTIYDLTGKQIVVYNPNDNNSSFTAAFNFSRGVYVSVIQLENGLTVNKKVMN